MTLLLKLEADTFGSPASPYCKDTASFLLKSARQFPPTTGKFHDHRIVGCERLNPHRLVPRISVPDPPLEIIAERGLDTPQTSRVCLRPLYRVPSLNGLFVSSVRFNAPGNPSSSGICTVFPDTRRIPARARASLLIPLQAQRRVHTAPIFRISFPAIRSIAGTGLVHLFRRPLLPGRRAIAPPSPRRRIDCIRSILQFSRANDLLQLQMKIRFADLPAIFSDAISTVPLISDTVHAESYPSVPPAVHLHQRN